MEPLESFYKKSKLAEVRGFVRSIRRDVRDLKARAQKIEACLSKGECPAKDLFKKTRRSKKRRARVLASLLNAASVPAVALRGIDVGSADRDAPFIYWVQILDKEWGAEVTRAKRASTLLWGPILSKSEIDQRFETRYAVVPLSSRYLATSARSNKEESRLFSLLSLHAAPVSAQAAFRLMLLIPIGTLVVAALRILVGMQMFGTFIPILLALSFRDIGVLWGVGLLGVLLLCGLLSRLILQRMQLLFVPRVSATLIIVIILMVLISRLSYEFQISAGLSILLFPMVIIRPADRETFNLSQRSRGEEKCFCCWFNTFLASMAVYCCIHPAIVRYWSFEFPETALACLAMVLLLGRYSGFRLLELFRFSSLRELDDLD